MSTFKNRWQGWWEKLFLAGDEKGSVLFISLIFLVIITLLTLSTSQTTVMDERMASNSKDRQMAFKATESAITGSQTALEAMVSLSAFTGTGGLLGVGNAEPDYLDATQWTTTSAIAYSKTIAGITTQPQYIVKLVGEILPIAGTKSLNIGGYGQTQGGKVYGFRITARGSGGTGTAISVIQVDYGKVF